MLSSYFIHLLITIGIYLVSALSLQLACGFSGMLNFGHISFFCIGAYIYGYMTIIGAPFWLCFLAASAGTALVAMVIAMLTGKLRGDYFSLTTLGFSYFVIATILNWREVTNGPLGLPGILRPDFLNNILNDDRYFLMFVLVGVILTYFFVSRLVASPLGKVMQAVRDDELAAKILGKNTYKTKIISLSISGFLVGFAGSLYAAYVMYIGPGGFYASEMLLLLCIVIFGGLASIRGTVISTMILVLLPEIMRFVSLPTTILGPGRQVLYSVLLLALIVYKPRGIDGKVELQ